MRWLLLLLFATFNALADLPTMEDPSRGQGQGIMETLQNYGFDIVVLLALAICAVGFLVVANNCIATYSEIQSGRKQWLDGGRRQHTAGDHHLAAQPGFGRPVIWRLSPFSPTALTASPWSGAA